MRNPNLRMPAEALASAGTDVRLSAFLEPELSSYLPHASFVTALNALSILCVRRAFGSLITLREHGGQEAVHLLVLNEPELPKHRHTDKSSDHFLDRQILINDFQHFCVVAFVRSTVEYESR
jgi:hypothetical protein